MIIDRNNIEAVMLDYLEGHLDPPAMAELMAFLAQHQEFDIMLPGYDKDLTLEYTGNFPAKVSLKKDFTDIPQINEQNFDEFCIAASEGILEDADLNRLTSYISLHPSKQRDYDIYRHLKLIPESSLVFPDKLQIKKRTGKIFQLRPFYYMIGGIAAAIALLILFFIQKPERMSGIKSSSLIQGDLPVQEQGNTLMIPQREAVSEKNPDITPPEVTTTHNLIAAEQPAAEIKAVLNKGSELLAALPKYDIPLSRAEEPAMILHAGTKPNEYYDQESASVNDSYLYALINKVDFWKAAASAVTAFGALTESQLALNKTTNDDGKLTGLLIETERLIITGK